MRQARGDARHQASARRPFIDDEKGSAAAGGMSSEVAANISKAQALKEEGNLAFKNGDYQQAMTAYHQIFMYVHGYSLSSGGAVMGMPGQTTTPVTAEEMTTIKELKLVHFNNLAMCHLKQTPPNLEKAVIAAKALELDQDNVKALFRRGKCYAQLNALDEAKEDLERVIELQPDNKDAARELRNLKGAFVAQRKKEQRKFAGLFDRMQADEEREGAQAASGSSGGGSSSSSAAAEGGRSQGGSGSTSSSSVSQEPSSMMVDPAADAVGGDAAGGGMEERREWCGQQGTRYCRGQEGGRRGQRRGHGRAARFAPDI